MITSELFWWSTKLWQLFLLESWAILLTVVVRIREEIFPRFQTPWCWIIRRRNSSIGSRKSRHRAAYIYKSTPQPLTRPHGPRPARGVSFWAWNWNWRRSRDARCSSGVQLLAFAMITTMSNKDSATITGTLIIIFILNLFLVVSFGRKETYLNTLRLVHHELAVSHSPRAGPSWPGPCGGWGVDL